MCQLKTKFGLAAVAVLTGALLLVAPGAAAAEPLGGMSVSEKAALSPEQKKEIVRIDLEAAQQLKVAWTRFQNLKNTMRTANKQALTRLMSEIVSARQQIQAMEKGGADVTSLKLHLEYLQEQYAVTKLQGKTEMRVLKKAYERQRHAIIDWREREIERVRSGS